MERYVALLINFGIVRIVGDTAKYWVQSLCFMVFGRGRYFLGMFPECLKDVKVWA